MKKDITVPNKVGDYHVLPLQLPSHPALSFEATHYIYFKSHIPKIPTKEPSHALFLVNIPIDSTETHLKHLFSSQLGLPAGRIQEVRFEDTPSKTHSNVKPITVEKKKSKKRKRAVDDGEEIGLIESTLPSTWDRQLRASGSTAIVAFVDKASLDAAFKVARAVHGNERKIVWGHGIEEKLPALGSQRKPKHIL